jgi:hypothetical protein
MAILFSFAIHSGVIVVSLPGTNFSRTMEAEFFRAGSDISSGINLMKQLTVALHKETQRRLPFKYLVLKLLDQFDYSLQFEPSIPEDRLEQLAYALHIHLRLHRLIVNGRDRTIVLWRRNLERWLRISIVEVIPLAMMFLSIYFMPSMFRVNPALFLVFLFVILYFFRFLGKGLWVLIIRKLVPLGYVKSLLLVRRSKLGLFDRFWIRLLWSPASWIGEK